MAASKHKRFYNVYATSIGQSKKLKHEQCMMSALS